MKMYDVTSSNIKRIGCDQATNKLRITFNSGHTWEYDQAAHHHAEMLKPGVSVGKYFNTLVRGKHDGRKIEEQ